MVYEMKNRFLLLGLTGPLGSGCTTTGKFLSGDTRNNISLKDLIKKQVLEEKQLDIKIRREYREIEKIKESISKRLSKKLGPYKNLIIDPNSDPTILKYEREASKRHNILKIYLRKREVVKILKKFLDDQVFHYDNLNNSRIHRLIFCANDAFGAIGGLKVLNDKYNLRPDAISGVCSSSPLHLRELSAFTDIPVFNSVDPDKQKLANLLLPAKSRRRANSFKVKAA